MVDVGKATRVQDKELRSQLDRMEIIEALRHGNIYEVLSKNKTFKVSDFHDFFADQWRKWMGDLIQDGQIKAAEGSYYEPDINQFAVHHKGVALGQDEGGYLGSELGKALRLKATTLDPAASDKMTPEELEDLARGTIGEWEQFMSDTWSQIMDAQMMSDYQSRMGEIKQEVERIISLAKQGAIAPEFVLIALAKVNATKNGVLMTWLGKKAFRVNESLSKIASDLHTLSPTDPRYASELQLGQSKAREGAFQMQLLQTDMQKVMQDIAGVIENVHSIMGEINRTRREIITKVSAT